MSGFDINQVTISGNLTDNPDLRTFPSGNHVTNLRIANNTRRKTNEGEWEDVPGFYDVRVWGGFGKWLGENLAKGDKVVVSGRLSWREWEKDGAKRSRVSIEADSVVPVPKSAKDTSTAPAPTPAGDEDIPF